MWIGNLIDDSTSQLHSPDTQVPAAQQIDRDHEEGKGQNIFGLQNEVGTQGIAVVCWSTVKGEKMQEKKAKISKEHIFSTHCHTTHLHQESERLQENAFVAFCIFLMCFHIHDAFGLQVNPRRKQDDY